MEPRPRLLLMEPQEDLRLDVEAVLEQSYCVVTAQNEAEGLRRLRDNAFAAVLWGTGPPSVESDPLASGKLQNLIEAMRLAASGASRFIILADRQGMQNEFSTSPCAVWVRSLPIAPGEVHRVFAASASAGLAPGSGS